VNAARALADSVRGLSHGSASWFGGALLLVELIFEFGICIPLCMRNRDARFFLEVCSGFFPDAYTPGGSSAGVGSLRGSRAAGKNNRGGALASRYPRRPAPVAAVVHRAGDSLTSRFFKKQRALRIN
jgi:hypothetical protein